MKILSLREKINFVILFKARRIDSSRAGSLADGFSKTSENYFLATEYLKSLEREELSISMYVREVLSLVLNHKNKM